MKKQTKKQKTKSENRITTFLSHVFIPHKHNMYQPHLIRAHGLVVIAVIVGTIQLSYNFIQTGAVLGVKSDITSVELLRDTNRQRQKNGSQKLNLNSKLNHAAALKANDMIRGQYWAHTAPDGTTPWKWFGAVNYKYGSAGENLARGFYTSGGVVRAWMDSAEHRENMLGNYEEVGFAVKTGVLDGEKTTLVVALYGSPKTSTSSRETVLAAVNDPQLGMISRIGVGVQSMTPALLGSIVLLLGVVAVALVAHAYRRKMPYAMQKSWRRHHGMYKAIGMMCLMFVLLALYGGGQI